MFPHQSDTGRDSQGFLNRVPHLPQNLTMVYEFGDLISSVLLYGIYFCILKQVIVLLFSSLHEENKSLVYGIIIYDSNAGGMFTERSIIMLKNALYTLNIGCGIYLVAVGR